MAQSLAQWRDADADLERPFWMPIYRGWATARNGLDFCRNHGWSEFMQLRVHMGRNEPVPSASITHDYQRTTTWVGYKVRLPESCVDALPHLVTQVETTIATSNDHQALPQLQADLAQRHRAPAEQLATGRQHGIDLVGPAPAGTADWQTHANQGYDHPAVQFNREGQYASCAQGRRSRQWHARLDRQGRSLIRVTFAKAVCLACPVRRHCTRSAAVPRPLSMLPRPCYEALQAARARQQTAAFKARHAQRAGIEGTLSPRVRACDLRRTRFVGHARTHLQHILLAVALNLVRLVAWFSGTPRVTTRPSPFARLFPATA